MSGRPALVIDPGLTLAWLLDARDRAGIADRAEGLMRAGGALVPGLWRMELADELLAAEAAGRIAAGETDRLIAAMAALPVTWVSVPTPIAELVALGRHHGLSGRQALYLDLARRESLPLATLDPALAAAARAEALPDF